MAVDDLPLVIGMRIALLVPAVLLNSFAVLFICLRKSLRKERLNKLLVLLSVSGIILGLFGLARVSTQLVMMKNYKKSVCLATGAVLVYGDHVAQMATFMIAAHRYKVLKSITSNIKVLSNRLYITAIVLVLVVCLVPSGLLFYAFEEEDMDTCLVASNWTTGFGHYMSLSTLFFNLAIIALSVATLALKKTLPDLPSLRHNCRLTAVVVQVQVVYIACWVLPKWAMLAAFYFVQDEDADNIMQIVASMGELLAANLHVAVYVVGHSEFRKELKMWLSGKSQIVWATRVQPAAGNLQFRSSIMKTKL
ncbi:hypothetical protein QR680_019039 [Steinernema hermaphroditum]|uniref:G-protein coupled receptors family 1 profile domain-containing protein n=1 Tax=Steinernema hermaphroditum TaxID=289476 RepID=A0AA39HL38_9BILA|nr:hypothetical protein QR680_019039 [Steinernema hermaphroditum]